ncbi:AraC family transcriptional regulator [Pseudomonas sp. gcc21]|uniref:AraC family transcriptional regulator n=1 Tax=Pseudomonas sp. gcc21 TaxID=2726989 RepID=UPI0014521B63|nr:AraC family transcriptional regulator [Pseudomonas sp. gcc21]QJD58226.1 AraC family transcriptional regulator [Pseudomonas sp. gcc21]
MYRVSTGYVGLLIRTLKAEGLDVDRLSAEAGLDVRKLKDKNAFYARKKVYRLVEMAAAQVPADVGLKVYPSLAPGHMLLVGYVMMSSATLQDALESLCRYCSLLSNGESITLTETAGGMHLQIHELPEAGFPMPRLYADVKVAAALAFLRWLVGGQVLQPLAVDFTYPEPTDTTAHQTLCGGSLRFGMPSMGIVFDRRDLQLPLSTADEMLARLHEEFAEARLSELNGCSLRSRVRALVMEHMSRGECDINTIAAALCVSKRTLQRGLEREGVQFKEVIDEARQQMADYYLRRTRYSLTEIVDRLGFYDQSSFYKASARWFGMPPGRYREHAAAC